MLSHAAFGDRFAAAVLGLPVHGEIAAVSEEQTAFGDRLFSFPHEVVNDVQIAFDGALAGRPGVLLLSGTGSMAWAGDASGRQCRVGGWGEAFGDEGSAYWIGREALSLATRALDGRADEEAFARGLLSQLGLEAQDLIAWCYAAPEGRRQAIASLARHVDVLAQAGDAAARDILLRAADHLVEHAEAGRSRLGLPSDFAWSYAGGVFANPIVMARVTERLGAPPLAPALPPVGGALLRAARLAGWAVDANWIGTLAEALAAAAGENAPH